MGIKSWRWELTLMQLFHPPVVQALTNYYKTALKQTEGKSGQGCTEVVQKGMDKSTDQQYSNRVNKWMYPPSSLILGLRIGGEGQVFHAAAVGAEHLAKQQQKSFGEGKGETSPLWMCVCAYTGNREFTCHMSHVRKPTDHKDPPKYRMYLFGGFSSLF